MRLARPGFTLIEVLIAVVLIDAGLLALVAGSAVLVRRAAELRARTAALIAASNRIQALGALPCATAVGSAAVPPLREDWTVVLQPNHERELLDRVTFTAGRDTHSVSLRTRLPC